MNRTAAAIFAALLLAPMPASAQSCSMPVNIRAAIGNVPTTSPAQERVSINYTFPYGPTTTTWNFPVTVPAGKVFLVTDMFFQDKMIWNTGANYRPNYFVLDGIYTLTSVQPSIQFKTPIRLPAGYIITGSVVSNAPATETGQNMIVGVNGCIEDAP